MLPSARVALCSVLLISGFYQSAHAISCPDFLKKVGAVVHTNGLVSARNAISIPRRLTIHRLNKKLVGRSIESFITESGTRLDLTGLNINTEELNYIYEVLLQKGFITTKLNSVRLAYNPALQSMPLTLFLKNISHVTQITELDLRGIYISSKSLEHISNYYPELKKLRMSVFNGRALRALNNNYKLEFIDFSEAFIRKSEVRVAPDESLSRPNVAVAELKTFITGHRRTLKTLLLPPQLPAQHENLLALGPKYGVHLRQASIAFKVDFNSEAQLNGKGGLTLNLNGKTESIFFSGLIAPSPKSYDVNELVVAHHLNLFLKNLAHEGVQGLLVAPIKTVEGTYYGDVYFKRLINGVEKGFLLSNLLSHMRLLTPVTRAWNNHNVSDIKVWKHLIDLHTQLEEQGAFSEIGSIK